MKDIPPEGRSLGTVLDVTVKMSGGLVGREEPDRVPPTPPRKRVIVYCDVSSPPRGCGHVSGEGKKKVLTTWDVKNPKMMSKKSELESAVGFVDREDVLGTPGGDLNVGKCCGLREIDENLTFWSFCRGSRCLQGG